MSAEQPFAIYHDALRSLAEIPGAREGVKMKDAKMKLFGTPGLFFRPGTTWEDVFHRMHQWGWINMEGSNIELIKTE